MRAARTDANQAAIVQAETLLANESPMRLASCPNPEDGAFDGSCPCGRIAGEGFDVDFHCWRGGCARGCQYSGIHVWGRLPDEILAKIARHIRDHNGWTDRTEWRLTVNGDEIK